MEPQIAPSTRDYTGAQIGSLANAVHIRLTTPLGSYHGNPALGSQLHLLQREKDLPRVGQLAVDYARQALAGLLTDSRARSIDISFSRTGNGYLLLHIELVDAGGQQQSLQHPVQVG